MATLELDSKITGRLKDLQESAAEFGRNVVRPAGIALDRLRSPLEVIAEKSVLWDVFRGFRERGLHKAMIPKAYGGTMGDMPPLSVPLVNEQMGYADGGLAVSLLVSGMPFALSILSADKGVRNWSQEYVRDTKSEMIGCWAITEPDHGTDWVMGTSREGCNPKLAPGLTAVLKGDEYIVNGWKSAWVSNGTVATHAVLHVGLDSSLGVHGSGIALCPLDLPGVSRGAALNKVGQRALNQGEIIFDNVKVHKKYMLISVPGFFGANLLGHAILGLANSSMGATFASQAQASFDLALAHARNTQRNGEFLCERKDIKIKLFRMFAKVEAARLLARKVAHHFFSMLSGFPVGTSLSSKATFWALGNAVNGYLRAYEKSEAVRKFSMSLTNPDKHNALMEWGKYGVLSKITATETACSVAEDAMQIFGEEALNPNCPIEKMLRDARASTIEDGVNDALAMASCEGL